ncbi:type I secretion system permease/ATPase [Ectopseudomonas mendocina]|uniref:Type I secretion system permease/ATPase n=1 Tax=Ectopseudomonas mendocina TaxID=300 RepID=A0ABZ2RB60_ECTME
MTTMERPGTDKDPRLNHDDPLLDGLLILCKLHGCAGSRGSLTAGLPLPEQRLTPDLLARAAARAGLQGRLLHRELNSISALNLPLLLLLKDGRTAVLRKFGDDGKVLILPCEADGGEQWVSRDDLAAEYTGQAFFARPRHSLEEAYRPLVPRVQAWFRDTLKLSRWLYADAVLASLLINLLGLMVPLFVMQTYDRVVPNQATSTLWVLAIGLMIGLGFELLLKVLRSHLLDTAGKKTDVVLSATLFERITGMSMSNRPTSVGGFAQSIHDFQGLRDFLTAVTLTSLIDLPFSLLMLLVIWLIGGWLVVIPLLAFPITALFAFIVQARLRDTVQKSLQLASQRQALLIETISGLETLKACCAESERQHEWEKTHGALSRLDIHSRSLAAIATNGTAFLQQFAGLATIVCGVYMIIGGLMSVGALVACYMLGSRILAPLGQIAGLITRYQQARLTMTSTDALMAMPQERKANQRPVERTQLQGGLEVRDVTFSYPGQATPALDGVTLKVKPGEHIGIIGRSGSGKSTLGRLIMSFYTPSKGQILLDNLDLRQLDVADLRHQIGYVAHDLPLLSGTLRDNLTLGARYVSDARILEIAELTGVSELARQHPQGFDRPVGERGLLLSGGQRQAVLLARALLLSPPILLLDEPTSAMDNTSEDILRRKLETWSAGKTMLLVTHRASMLSLVDRLVVVDNGKIVADGPKEAVIEALRKGRIGSAAV